MLALSRDFVKHGHDAVDFAGMVKHSMDEGGDPIDLDRLAESGKFVWPRGGGKEIPEFVEKAKAGEGPDPTQRPR